MEDDVTALRDTTEESDVCVVPAGREECCRRIEEPRQAGFECGMCDRIDETSRATGAEERGRFLETLEEELSELEGMREGEIVVGREVYVGRI